uniref:Uncharacterized protein n=1 Tax=Caenorhabditis japonica TaxID=281687 RepID=A0A8R1DQR1_CAEJA
MPRPSNILIIFSILTVKVSAYIPFEFQTLNYSPVEFSFNDDNDLDEQLLTNCCTETVNFNFRAYGRDFPLRLSRNCVSGEEDRGEAVEFTDGGATWQGRLEDQPNSTVDGDVIDGKFAGIIITGDGEKFMVERQKNGQGHSLIYRISSRKLVEKTLFPKPVIVDKEEGSGQEGSGLEVS